MGRPLPAGDVALDLLLCRVDDALGRITMERSVPALSDIGLRYRDHGSDDERRRLLVEKTISTGCRHGTPKLIGLIGNDRDDVAALDHIKRDRLGEIEGDDPG